MRTSRARRAIDHVLALLLGFGKWLVLPVALLLFLQWPLRDVVGRYSREANDLGQSLFALYVAMSITAATRRRTHLAADALADAYPDSVKRALARVVSVVALLPWTIFILWSGSSVAWRSLLELERFPETYTPGYFVIKAAVIVFACFMLAQTVIDLDNPSAFSGYDDR